MMLALYSAMVKSPMMHPMKLAVLASVDHLVDQVGALNQAVLGQLVELLEDFESFDLVLHDFCVGILVLHVHDAIVHALHPLDSGCLRIFRHSLLLPDRPSLLHLVGFLLLHPNFSWGPKVDDQHSYHLAIDLYIFDYHGDQDDFHIFQSSNVQLADNEFDLPEDVGDH